MQTSWSRRFETVGERSAWNELLSSLSPVLAIYFSAKVSAQQSGKTHARLVAAKLWQEEGDCSRLTPFVWASRARSCFLHVVAEQFRSTRRGVDACKPRGRVDMKKRRRTLGLESNRPGEQSAWRVAFCASHASAKKSTKRRVNMSLEGIALILHLCAAATRVRLFFENSENNQSRRHCSSSTPLVPATRAWFCFEIQEKSKRVLHAKC